MCKEEGQREEMSEGSLVQGQGHQKRGPPARSRPFSIFISILCGSVARHQISTHSLTMILGWSGRATWGSRGDPEEKHISLGNCNYLKTMSKQKPSFPLWKQSYFHLSTSYLSVSFHIGLHLSSSLPLLTALPFPFLVQNSPRRGIDQGAARGRCCFSTTVSTTALGPAPDTFTLGGLFSAPHRPQVFRYDSKEKNSSLWESGRTEEAGGRSWPGPAPCLWKKPLERTGSH